MKTYSKSLPKVFDKVFCKTDPQVVSLALGLTYPPLRDKLVAWLPFRSNLDNSTKREIVNAGHFTIQNCPPDYWLDGNGEQILDGVGDPLWADLLYTGWECEYLAPASGQPGHTELLAIDDGTLYTTGVPNVLTRPILEALSNDQMFFCKNNLKGLAIFSEVLIGAELAEVSSFFSCYQNTFDTTDITMDSGLLTMDNIQ